MTRHLATALLLIVALHASVVAQPAAPDKDPNWLLPLGEVNADPKIPTLEQVLGYRWGQEITSHAEIERYLDALTKMEEIVKDFPINIVAISQQ